MHKVSLIVLTTGASERLGYLDKLLWSVSRQTMRPSEFIIASEVSSSKLEELLRKYFCPCKNHRIIATGHWNKCRTANRAIKQSRGDIVFLLEDDLILNENFMEEMLDAFDLDPRVGCVYSRCIWIYREGLRSKRGVKGFVAKPVSKLSVHEYLFPRQVRKINDHLSEVAVFTMSVACTRDALCRAGLYDEGVDEPIQGEDYDLALRVRAKGYKIIANSRATSYHFTRQVAKRKAMIHEDAKHIHGVYKSEIYFLTKNRGMLGPSLYLHMFYRLLEAFSWTIRTQRLKAIAWGISGIVEGYVRALRVNPQAKDPSRALG